MKKIARNLILAIFAFLIVASFYQGIHYSSPYELGIAAVAFAILTQFVKPAIKLLMLPFNLLTFGLVSSLSSLVILYLVAFFVHGFSLVAFHFSGLSFSGFILPAVYLSAFLSALVASVLIGLVSTILQSLFK